MRRESGRAYRRKYRRLRRKRKTRKIIRIFVLLALLAVLLFAGLKIREVYGDWKEGRQETAGQNAPGSKDAVNAGQEKQKETQDQGAAVSLEDFYYGKLTKVEQEQYNRIFAGLMDMEETIPLESIGSGETERLLKFVLKDHPELFWCGGGANLTVYDSPFKNGVDLKPVYNCTAKERKARQEEIDRETRACLSGIGEAAGDYEKILYVYEYVIDHTDYDADAPDNQNIYSALVAGRSVCAGYSRTMQYLLKKLGVFCTYVTGEAGTGGRKESHAWNLVQCDGVYYYVDATWGDPVYMQREGAGDDSSDMWEGVISYDYMCCSGEELFRTHMLEEDAEFPECTSMAHNYYVVNGMYYESYDRETVLKDMQNGIAAKENPFVAKFADESAYGQAREEILGELAKQAARNLGELYGIGTVKYSYQDGAELNKITIYWEYE